MYSIEKRDLGYCVVRDGSAVSGAYRDRREAQEWIEEMQAPSRPHLRPRAQWHPGRPGAKLRDRREAEWIEEMYAKLRDRMNRQYWKFYWRGGYDEAFALCRRWERWWSRRCD